MRWPQKWAGAGRSLRQANGPANHHNRPSLSAGVAGRLATGKSEFSGAQINSALATAAEQVESGVANGGAPLG